MLNKKQHCNMIITKPYSHKLYVILARDMILLNIISLYNFLEQYIS